MLNADTITLTDLGIMPPPYRYILWDGVTQLETVPSKQGRVRTWISQGWIDTKQRDNSRVEVLRSKQGTISLMYG